MDAEKLLHSWRLEVEKYAKAHADMIYLREFRKSKKAILINEAMSKGIKTAQERESYAYAHPEYIALLEGLRDATCISEELRWRMEIAKQQISVYQTKCADRRKERSGYGA